MVDVPISHIFSLESGLILSTKGSHSTYETDVVFALDSGIIISYTIRDFQKYNLYYIDMPIRLKIKKSVSIVGLSLSIDTYLSRALSGKYIREYKSNEEEYNINRSITWNEEDNFNRYDYGVSAGITVGYKSYVIAINHERGMRKALLSSYDWLNSNQKVFRISLAYVFNLKK